jgi:hypothetical protein
MKLTSGEEDSDLMPGLFLDKEKIKFKNTTYKNDH